MKLIAHRCNIDGPNELTENTIISADTCYKLLYDFEIDIWLIDNKILLGHDIITKKFELNEFKQWIKKYKKHVWIHCKNIESLIFCNEELKQFNYFGHNSDQFVLTSQQYIFTCPNNLYGKNVVCVMPELNNNLIVDFSKYCAILTDYIKRYECDYNAFRAQPAIYK